MLFFCLWIQELISLMSIIYLIQKIKFTARLLLLEHGLLDAAQALEAMSVDPSSSTIGKRLDIAEEEEDTAPDPDEAAMNDFEGRVNLFVQASLHRAQASGRKRDSYKEMLVYQARKETIQAFGKHAMAKKCAHCGACVPLPIFTCRILINGHPFLIDRYQWELF
jgi:hypothetical protein